MSSYRKYTYWRAIKEEENEGQIKPDIDLEEEEPFKAKDVQVMETSYVDKTPLDLANTCIFKGEFYDQDKKKVGMVLLPDTFFDLHQVEPNMKILRHVGLDGYFGLEPWGVDLQRTYELMTTINKEGVATLSPCQKGR